MASLWTTVMCINVILHSLSNFEMWLALLYSKKHIGEFPALTDVLTETQLEYPSVDNAIKIKTHWYGFQTLHLRFKLFFSFKWEEKFIFSCIKLIYMKKLSIFE